jgi:D-3-phosphoglycerate dehydrogenase
MGRLAKEGIRVVDPGHGVELSSAQQLVPMADVLIVGGTHLVPAEVIRSATRLRLISRLGSGVDNIDTAAATELGILVCNTAGSNADSVADHTFAMILALERRLIILDDQTKSGHGWDSGPAPNPRHIAGQTIGVIGTGKVGSEVVRRAASGFKMRVLGHDVAPNPELIDGYAVRYVALDQLLVASTIVTIHVPLTPSTRGMIGQRELELMPQSSILINTARGGIVDESALKSALDSGHLAGAGVDVFEREPCSDSPLFASERVVVTPHAARQSPEASRHTRLQAVDNIVAFLAGHPINQVNAVALGSTS